MPGRSGIEMSEDIKVLMRMTDIHNAEDGEEDKSEITSIASYNGTKEDYIIKYNESGDFAGCEASLNVKNGKTVVLRRTGNGYDVQMIMEKGKRHVCYYKTPFGELMLGVCADEVVSDIENGKGKLKFRYSIDCNTGVVSENDITINLTNA